MATSRSSQRGPDARPVALPSYPFADGGELSADGDEDRRRQRHL